MSGTTFPSYPGYNSQPSGGYHSNSAPENNQQQVPQQQHQPQPQQQQPQDNGWRNQNNQGGGGGWKNQNEGGYRKPYQGGGGGGDWKRNGGGSNGGGWKKPDDGDLSLYKPYAATGNDGFPPEIEQKFKDLALRLEALGYTARVGGMKGVEEIVEKTVKKHELHLPWRGFNEKESRFTYNSERAFSVARMYHPTFDTMAKGVQAFLAKNARLILGDKLTSPVLFLLCWTEDGADSIRNKTARTGFTGHPIAIASSLGIPVFNMGKPDTEQRFNFYLESLVNVENISNQPSQ